MSRRKGYNHCPNCDKKFIFRPEQQWCNEQCQIAFWENQYTQAMGFLLDKGLFDEYNQWVRDGNS
jgi:predicted nucleic acid-binding Zn ribbon protein